MDLGDTWGHLGTLGVGLGDTWGHLGCSCYFATSLSSSLQYVPDTPAASSYTNLPDVPDTL